MMGDVVYIARLGNRMRVLYDDLPPLRNPDTGHEWWCPCVECEGYFRTATRKKDYADGGPDAA